MSLTLRKLQAGDNLDQKKVWKQRTADDTRKWFFNSNSFSYDSHLKWFDRQSSYPDFHFFIVSDGPSDIGYFTVTRLPNTYDYEMQMVIFTDFRGKGYAKAILDEVMNKIKELGGKHLISRTFAHNIARRRANERIQMDIVGTEQDGTVIVYRKPIV